MVIKFNLFSRALNRRYTRRVRIMLYKRLFYQLTSISLLKKNTPDDNNNDNDNNNNRKKQRRVVYNYYYRVRAKIVVRMRLDDDIGSDRRQKQRVYTG